MLHRGGGPLINDPLEEVSPAALATDKMLTKWLARVRGPEAVDAPLYPFPRLTGNPTAWSSPNSSCLWCAPKRARRVYGDGNGNIWYTSHLSRYFGKLESAHGRRHEHQALDPGAQPGTHHVYVEKNGERAHFRAVVAQAAQGRFSQRETRSARRAPFPINSAGMADLTSRRMDLCGRSMGGGYAAEKIDPKTGKMVQKYPMKVPFSYDGIVSQDGNFWAGGAISGTLEIRGASTSGPARC